jgi:hypothetical protein
MVTTFAPPILTNFGGKYWRTGALVVSFLRAFSFIVRIASAGFATRAQGYGASSLWKQRAHRWTVSALRITGKSLYSFFTYNTRGGVMSNIAFRLYRYLISHTFCSGRCCAVDL